MGNETVVLVLVLVLVLVIVFVFVFVSGAVAMTEPIFDHDRLDVYRLSVEYTAESFRVAQDSRDFIVTPAINGCGRLNPFH